MQHVVIMNNHNQIRIILKYLQLRREVFLEGVEALGCDKGFQISFKGSYGGGCFDVVGKLVEDG